MSAEPTNIMPFPTAKATLDQLVEQWIAAKKDEDFANSRRIAIEQQICALQPPKEEGATTVELADGKKLTVTGKLTYKADVAKLQALAARLPEELRPLKTETKADETGLKYLRNNEPKLWEIIAPAVEVKPAKTSFGVKF